MCVTHVKEAFLAGLEKKSRQVVQAREIFLLNKQLLKLTFPMGKGPGSHPQQKSLSERSKKWPRQAKCKSCLLKDQAGIQGFFSPF